VLYQKSISLEKITGWASLSKSAQFERC
jgi:hypothetical protein